jgi:hypothetical protein
VPTRTSIWSSSSGNIGGLTCAGVMHQFYFGVPDAWMSWISIPRSRLLKAHFHSSPQEPFPLFASTSSLIVSSFRGRAVHRKRPDSFESGRFRFSARHRCARPKHFGDVAFLRLTHIPATIDRNCLPGHVVIHREHHRH